MTACNLWVGPSAAYLLTDTAGYHDDGTVLAFASKISASARNRIAVALNGTVFAGLHDDLTAALDAAPSQAAALASLPPLLASMQREAASICADPACANGLVDPILHAFIAIWHEDRRRGEGYILAPTAGLFGPGYEAGTVRGVRCLTSPPVPDGPDPSSPRFDPCRDGRMLIEAQRRYRDDRDLCRVGGEAELTTVDVSGVSTRTIWRWPDKVGEPIAVRVPCETVR